jgi:hypothetical protein
MTQLEQRFERLAALTCGDFDTHLGQGFQLSTDQQRLEVQLIRVQAFNLQVPEAQGRSPFSLWFRGPHRPQLAQGTFCVDHPVMGELAMFLVPIGVDADGMRYEAIFA